MWTRIVAAAGMLSLVSALSSAAPDPPLRATVSPRVASSPAMIRVQAVVRPDADNHALVVVIDSPTYYRGSTVPLDGAHSSRLHSAEFRAVPVGDHVVTVALLDGQGRTRAAVHEAIRIVH